jgi:hypothetical protein
MLGITEPALRNLVNQGKIKKYVPPGRQTGLYLREEVDAFAEKWFAFLTAEEPTGTRFEIAQPEDMEAVTDIAQRAIHPITPTAAVRRQWLAKNPESCYVVKHNNKVVAFFHLIPADHNALMAFMEGKIRGWEIQEEVLPFEPGNPLEGFVIIASDPDIEQTKRMHYVRVLLRGTREEFRKLGQRGVIITKIYATSETPTGIAMALHAGMEPYGQSLGKRQRFIMDVEKSNSFLATSYKEGLREWKKKQHASRLKTLPAKQKPG